MKEKTISQRVPTWIFISAVTNASFLVVNGLFMLVAPSTWYHLVPGVTQTGPFNPHFVRDIGLIQMFLGALLGLGFTWPEGRLVLWSVSTAWLVAHALLHLWEVVAGICHPSAIARDFPAVGLPALLGIGLTTWAWRAFLGAAPSNSAFSLTRRGE